MRKAMLLFVLGIISGLMCSSLLAEERGGAVRGEYPGVSQEQGNIRRDSDWNENPDRGGESPVRGEVPYDRLFEEMERLRGENRALRDEIQFLRDEITRLMSETIERQREEIHTLRMMLEEQHNFTRELLKQEYEFRKARQLMELRPIGMDQPLGDMERKMKEVEEELSRRPDDVELRMKLAQIYRDVGNIDGAMEQYKAILSINPDFDPAYRALEELRSKFSDDSGGLQDVLIERFPGGGKVERFPGGDRAPERPLMYVAGEVVSADKKEVKLRLPEGDEAEFMVPLRQREDGSWAPAEDLSNLAGSLNPGARIRILWEEIEGQRIIRKIERMEGEE